MYRHVSATLYTVVIPAAASVNDPWTTILFYLMYLPQMPNESTSEVQFMAWNSVIVNKELFYLRNAIISAFIMLAFEWYQLIITLKKELHTDSCTPVKQAASTSFRAILS
ncbi:hypothetical protein B0H34DRAFT_494318 [Crassisporium funariophilum]|nr:hypothetical protein B0H34DRAFT_494318 [Crassisporium funariophilum]